MGRSRLGEPGTSFANRGRVVALAVLGMLFAGGARAADPVPPPPPASASAPAPSWRTDRVLKIGTTPAPPFVFKGEDGTWSGISIDLWQEIAETMDLKYEIEERSLEGLFEGTRDGSLDLAVGPLTIEASREKVIDFCQPYYRTGLAIAVPRHGHDFVTLVRGVVRLPLLHILFSLVGLLFLIAVLVWFFERKDNPDQFGGPGMAGIWSAFWWAASTMTTVGYGDKAPVTVVGRAIAMLWMFSGIVIISSFTATITTALALQHLSSPIRGPGDLAGNWVATIAGTTSEEFLKLHNVRVKYYPDVESGLRAVASREVDAMVYDEPLLNYASIHQLPGEIDVLPGTFDQETYGFALPLGSVYRKPINVVLLEKLHAPFWKRLTSYYLGN